MFDPAGLQVSMLPSRVPCAVLLLGLSLILAMSCSDDPKPKGQLMLVLKTDMEVPKDVTAVRLVVISGVPRHDIMYELGPGEERVKLPGTIAIVAGDGPSLPVRIRVIAYRGPAGARKPFVLREAVTTVPTDRVAMLPLPLSWLCWGKLEEVPPVDLELDFDAVTDCDVEGQTCKAGRCVSASIESSTLPDYVPELVFGGAAGPGAGGVCHDTLACFDGGFQVAVNIGNCTIPAPIAGAEESYNVGLVLPPGDRGVCNSSGCLVPLDRAPEEGFELGTNEVTLPGAVCDRILDGSVRGVVVTLACPTKTPAIPTCGPWSAVSSQPGTLDGGAMFPLPDPCYPTLGSDGPHCGSDLPGGDPGLLYTCQNGATTRSQSCSDGCTNGACSVLDASADAPLEGGPDAAPDAGPPTIGSPCIRDADCGAALTFGCLAADSQAFFDTAGPANGMCSLECSQDPTLCGPGAVCVHFETASYCLRSCALGAGSGCGRTDLACEEVIDRATDRATGGCVPVCSNDIDCPGRECNFATGFCEPQRPRGARPIGSGCAMMEDCATGFCRSVFEDAGVVQWCSALCVIGEIGCGWDGIAPAEAACVVPAQPPRAAGDLGFCTELCDAANYCSCTNSGELGCEPLPPALELVYGRSGYCLPHWQTSSGGAGC
jgi:hypothetical protein